MAYRYLSYKPRTTREMINYLNRKKVNEEEIQTIIKHLTDKDFINDETYSEWYIKNRIKFNPKSTFALRYELKQKGISTEICDSLLAGLDDLELANKTITKKLNSWKHLNPDIFKKKMINHLKYRGFNSDICMRLYKQYKPEEGS